MKHMEHVIAHAKKIRSRAHAKTRELLPVGLVLTDLLLAALVVVQFFSVYVFYFDELTRTANWTWSTDAADYLALSAAILVFVFFHRTIVRRHESIKRFFDSLLSALSIEWSAKKREWSEDRRLFALLLFDGLVVASVVLALFAFLDPDLELVAWEKLGIFSPWTTLLNAVLFAIVLGVYYYLYSYTKPFRELHRARKKARAVTLE